MNKIVLKITGLITMLIGIIWCFTIIGLIIGIPNIIGGIKFINLSNMGMKK